MSLSQSKSRLVTHLSLIVLCLSASSIPAWGQVKNGVNPNAHSKNIVLPDYDIRDFVGLPTAGSLAPAAQALQQRAANLETLRRAPGNGSLRVVPNRYGLPKLLMRHNGLLSVPSTSEPEEIAREFLRSHRTAFPFDPGEVDRLRVVVKDVTPSATFLALNQTLDGIEVYNGQIKMTLTARREVAQVSAADAVPGLTLSTAPQLTPSDAAQIVLTSTGGMALATPQLTIVPMGTAAPLLAYRVLVRVDARRAYEIVIDASQGNLLMRHGLTRSLAQARVWTQSPLVGSRQLVTIPSTWIDGAVTTGNNVDAYLDWEAIDFPNDYYDPTMQQGRAFSPVQIFDFPFGTAQTNPIPPFFPAASVTNMFYFLNSAHDYFYNLGFNEAAGNFQTNNFGRGGLGNDPVLGEAQQGLEFDNSSNMVTPDGISPIIRMGLFVAGAGIYDSDFDGQTAFHEYTHGVSTRLVGARTSTTCLSNIQSGAMGEGWSDYFAISYFNNPVLGTYLTQDSKGLRRQSYEGYTYTYEDIGNGQHSYEPHDDGEIWAATLWELRSTLGQAVTDQLVINGLKSTPCNPSMIDARDAILTADQATNGGANRARIWRVFAKHGMGYSAAGVDGDSVVGTVYNAAYDQPPDLQSIPGPRITSDPLQSLAFHDNYSYQVTATNPAGGTLSYTLSAGPDGMTVSPNGLTQWNASFAPQRVKIAVSDGKGGRTVNGFLLPVETPIPTNTPVLISGASGSVGWADVNVPPGTSVLQVSIGGGTGDADLLLATPNGFEVGVSENYGNAETLSIPNPTPGHWIILVPGYTDYAGASLSANLVTPQLLPANASVSGLKGASNSESFYRIHVPAGAGSLRVATSGGTGDVDILLRYNGLATCTATCAYDTFSANNGNGDSITIAAPKVGDYYIDLIGYLDYAGVRLTVSLNEIPTLSVTPSSVSLTVENSNSPPAGQAILISGGGLVNYNWTAQVSTSSGANWLSLSRTSGSGDSLVQITANPAGLPAGTYRGTITVAAPNLLSSPQAVPVTLTVRSGGVATVNLALGKPATQSSTYGYPSAVAASAVDGNTDGNFFDGSVTATNVEPSPWWQVDLGKSTPIQSITVWNRTDCCSSRLLEFFVFVSNTPFQPTDTPEILVNKPGVSVSYVPLTPNPSITVPIGTQARYVRVQLAGTGYLSLAEVQVQ